MSKRIYGAAAGLWLACLAAPAGAQSVDPTSVPTPSADGLFEEGPTVEPFRGFPDLSASLGWGLALASSLVGAPLLFIPHLGATANWDDTFREESQDGVGAYPPGVFPGFAPAQLHVGFAIQAGKAMLAFRSIVEARTPKPALKHEVSYQRPF